MVQKPKKGGVVGLGSATGMQEWQMELHVSQAKKRGGVAYSRILQKYNVHGLMGNEEMVC